MLKQIILNRYIDWFLLINMSLNEKNLILVELMKLTNFYHQLLRGKMKQLILSKNQS